MLPVGRNPCRKLEATLCHWFSQKGDWRQGMSPLASIVKALPALNSQHRITWKGVPGNNCDLSMTRPSTVSIPAAFPLRIHYATIQTVDPPALPQLTFTNLRDTARQALIFRLASCGVYWPRQCSDCCETSALHETPRLAGRRYRLRGNEPGEEKLHSG